MHRRALADDIGEREARLGPNDALHQALDALGWSECDQRADVAPATIPYRPNAAQRSHGTLAAGEQQLLLADLTPALQCVGQIGRQHQQIIERAPANAARRESQHLAGARVDFADMPLRVEKDQPLAHRLDRGIELG